MAVISDPKALRAMAHPVRMRLLEALTSEGTATATRCAQLLGDTASNCSFHLRLLGRYGFVERAPGGTGRERPWRLTSVTQDLRPDPADPDAVAAGRAVDETLLSWEMGRISAAIRTAPDPDWQGTRVQGGASMWLTAQEARELSAGLGELVGRFIDRAGDPTQRPAGARPLRLFFALSPITDLHEADPSTDPAP